VTVRRSLEDLWREVSPYLDEVLDLKPEARQAWLDALEMREPELARHVHAYLEKLEQNESDNFLGVPVASALSVATLAGQRFGSYTLDQLIGQGGMGTVWLAHRSDGRFEGQAAVKLLHPALVGHPSEQRFAREGNVLASLRHPNIAQLFDAGVVAGNQPYLVLEYVRGERIDLYCERRNLDIAQRITLFLDVLAAVAHAHRNLIVHRDLKPPNILVTEHGTVKLLDFGIAALLSPQTNGAAHELTHHIAPGLTPGYAAPEQLLGETITTGTDVYSLGVVLFLLLTGTHPASPEGKTTDELRRLTLEADAPRPSERAGSAKVRRSLRGDLDNIVAMALRKSPADRYSTVELFSQDLRRYLLLEPVSARPSSWGYLFARFVRRHRASVAVATAVAAVLIGAVVVTTAQMVEARRQRDEARYQSRRAEASKDFLKMLTVSNLTRTGPALNFHERLEFGVELLKTQYRDDPKFAGRMLVELGNGYRDNQETRPANELYQKAYDIGKKSNDVELMTYAQCNRISAEAIADIRDGVMERIANAQELLRRINNPEADLQARCLMGQAAFERRLGHSELSEEILRRALHILETDDGTSRDIYLDALGQLGEIHLARNQPLEYLRISQRIGAIMERNGRGRTVEAMVAHQNVAVALNAMGESRAALAEREIIRQRVSEIESPGSEPVLYAVNYASVLQRMGRPIDALHALEGTLERARGTGNPLVLTQTLLVSGLTFIALERWTDAEIPLQEAVALASRGIGNQNMGAQAESALALLALGRGDMKSAHYHSEHALTLGGYGIARRERGLAKVLMIASRVALAEHEIPNAERFARDALSIGEPVARGPYTSADVGEALLRLAQARKVSDAADIRALLERAVKSLTNGLASDHPLTAEARALLSKM